MAFIYEVNGQRVEFEKEPTEKDIDEAARSLGKSKPESKMPKPVEGSGGAAFGVYRPAGRRPESQQDREASSEMAIQTARGIASNIPAIAGIPGSIANAAVNAPRTAQDISNRYQIAREAFTGQAPQVQPLPEPKQVTPYDMSYFAGLTPGPRPTSPQGQLAFGAGQAVGAPIVPPVLKAGASGAKAAGSLVKDVGELAMSPVQTAKTGSEAFMRGYRNPEMMGQKGSAMIPIRETYYPHEQVAEYQAGTRPATQMTERPTSELIQSPVQQWAQNMAPVNPEGQALVAPKGKGFEGYMESLGAGYKQNPTQQIIDAVTGLGGIALTGLPTPATALAKSVPALAARTLQKATQFEPGFEASAVQAQQARSALEAGQPPTQNLLPAPGPVQPTPIEMPGPQRNVNIEGESFTLPNQIDVSNSQAARPIQPVNPAATPKEISQQVAASKIQQPQINPEQQAILDQIRARGQQQPTLLSTPEPTVQPVVPEGAANLPAERWTLAERLQIERDRLKQQPQKEMTPNEEAEMKKGIKEVELSSQQRGTIIKEWVDGKRLVEGEAIDVSKGAYNRSNRTRSQAEKLLKAGIDEIPTIQGATPSQVIDAMYGYIEKNKPEMFKAKRGPKKKGPDVSKMMTEEDKNKFFNKIKSSGESEVEQKVAGMSQAGRDQLAKTLKGQLNESTKDLIQPYLDAIEKYRTNK